MLEKLIFFISGFGLGMLLCWWIGHRLFLSAAASFHATIKDKQIEIDCLTKEYLLELSRAIAAEYIKRDEAQFTGMMRGLRREYSQHLTDHDKRDRLLRLGSKFPDIKAFSLADTFTCVSPSFRFEDLSNEDLSQRFKKIMSYLRLRFEYEDIESVDYWILEQRERQEERELAAEIDRVKRSFEVQTKDHSPQIYVDYCVGQHYICSSYDVPFGVEYTFLPANVLQDFDSDDWYVLGWQVSTPEEKEYVSYFKRIGDAKGRTIMLDRL